MAKGINWKELAKAKGKVVTGSDKDIISLEKKEDYFIGKFIKSEPVEYGDKSFTSFVFETEKGIQNFAGGVSFEQSMRIINHNSIIRVTSTGKKKTKAGHKVNTYQIELLEGSINEKEKEKLQKEIAANVKKANKNKKGKK